MGANTVGTPGPRPLEAGVQPAPGSSHAAAGTGWMEAVSLMGQWALLTRKAHPGPELSRRVTEEQPGNPSSLS